MRKTFIINLTRFGDLIQTQPVLRGYKAQGIMSAWFAWKLLQPQRNCSRMSIRSFLCPGHNYWQILIKVELRPAGSLGLWRTCPSPERCNPYREFDAQFERQTAGIFSTRQ